VSPFVRRSSVRHADRLLARSVLLLALALYTATFAGLPEEPTGELAFQSARSMARGGLALTETPELDRLVSLAEGGDGTLPLRAGCAPRAAALYSCQGLAQGAVGVPFYWLGAGLGVAFHELQSRHAAAGTHAAASEYFEHLLFGWRNPLLGALTAALVVLAARRLGAERPHAWFAGVTYAGATFAWSQARGALPEVQIAFLLMLALHLILRLRERFERLKGVRRRTVWGLGIVLGVAALTHPGALPAVIVLGITARIVLLRGERHLARSRWAPVTSAARRGSGAGLGGLTAIAGPLLLALVAGVALDHWRFDAWFTTYRCSQGSASSSVGRLMEWLVSPGSGLLWTAPLILFVPLGLRRNPREADRLFTTVLLVVAACVAASAALTADPAAPWGFGPRPLLPALPFLWVAVGLGLGLAVPGSVRRRFAFTLAALGLLIQVPSALVGEATYQELAPRAARVAWPDDVLESPGSSADLDAERQERIPWSWRFAAPWVNWRILRHRIAGLGEELEVDEIFRVEGGGTVSCSNPRARGFRHLAWVDFSERLGGPVWPVVLLVLSLAVAGAALAVAGLDQNAP